MHTITIEPVERRCTNTLYKASVDASAGSIIKWYVAKAPTNVDKELVEFKPQGARNTYFSLPFVGDYEIFATVKTPK